MVKPLKTSLYRYISKGAAGCERGVEGGTNECNRMNLQVTVQKCQGCVFSPSRQKGFFSAVLPGRRKCKGDNRSIK